MTSEPFKIQKISINKFYAEEYIGPKKIIDEKSLFIYGTNNTGKSTSFDGIIYSIFGWDFIDRKSKIADTEIELKNNEFLLKIQRKYNSEPLMEIRKISGERKGERAEIKGKDNIYNKLLELIGIPKSPTHAKKLIAALTIPQRDDDSLLRKYNDRDLEYIISTYSSGLEAISRIREIEKEVEIKKSDIEKIKYKKLDIEKEINDIELEEKRNKHYISELKEFIQQYDSKDLFKTIEILNKNKEINETLIELNSKRTGYYDKKYKISKEISDHKQYYKKELIDAIKSTLSVLVCPVCEDDLDLNKIENRKNRGLCPFCGSNHNPEKVYKIIENEINVSNKKFDSLEKEAKEIEHKIKEIDEKNKEISKKILISIINPVIIRSTNETVDGIREKYEQYKTKIKQYETDIAENEEKIIENKKYIKKLDDATNEISENIIKLERESVNLKDKETKEGVYKFNKELNKNYSKLISPQPYNLELDSGKIILHKNAILKDCSDRDSLGYSERKLIDFALWTTFLSINKINNNVRLNFGIVDDIFENIDNTEIKWKDNLLLMLNNIKEKCQLIIFSIDKEINKSINLDILYPLQFQNLGYFVQKEEE
ncbi:MAG: hypothetical protein OIN86_07395 [Candidatus Methanoperedens sp.]|nr:hypothetical protein [Candidatus Methanoperedens sp.]CAG0987790.1 hypothetical protein METP1_02128 [Methanosarcinales archaeon]